MQQTRYTKEPGFIYDLIFIFVLYFNKEMWIKKFVNADKGKEDFEFYEGILNKFPPFPEELKPFFYLKDNGSFMSTQYFQESLEGFFNGHDINLLYKELTDENKMRNKLARYYINSEFMDHYIEKSSIYELSKMLLKQNLPDDVKQTLMLILMEPKVYCEKLIEIFKSVEKVLDEYYRNHYDLILNVCNSVTKETIENYFRIARDSEYQVGDTELEISVCLIHVNLFRLSYINSKACAIVGIYGEQGADSLKNGNANIDIALFGKIMSDSSRIKVIKLLSENGELFTGEIAQALGAALPSAYYHLEMMMDANMLHSRSKGRTVYYSINHDYFTAATAEIMKLIK